MKRRRILILDDDHELQTLIALLLKREGYEPICTDNILELTNLWHISSFDLLIMSGGLEFRDWWSHYLSLKAAPALQSTGIIVALRKVRRAEVEAHQLREIQENGDSLLADYLPAENLIETVKKMLGDDREALLIKS